ncbi:hypothetical protein ACIPY0_20360 [Paenarthrobacter nicotinovorans]|uniref:hypothetical protein n=1 Tax=Paenarthrobacter nicotinovorans TaxID=29320 RepID=UPI003830A3E3
MTRSRASAKAAGSRHERSVADYLKLHVSRFVDRMPKYGAKDRGDIGNVETFNQLPVAVEAKDYGGRIEAGTWLREAATERINLGAVAGVVIAKRRGTTDPGRQIVLMEVNDLVALLTGKRPV